MVIKNLASVIKTDVTSYPFYVCRPTSPPLKEILILYKYYNAIVMFRVTNV